MKHLAAMSVLFLVFSLSANVTSPDIRPDARERIDELVLEPLRAKGIWPLFSLSSFSRAVVIVEPSELRLWTSAPANDAEGRSFVPFRVQQLTDVRPTTIEGCYYPGDDVAYLFLDFVKAYVPVGQHPVLTMQLPHNPEIDGTLCRAKD